MTSAVLADGARPVRSRARRWRPSRRTLLIRGGQLLIVLAFVGAWERFSGNGFTEGAFIDEFYFSRPSDIWSVLVEWLGDGTIVEQGSLTLQATAYGWALGVALGLLVGFALGVSEKAYAFFSPFIVAGYAVPRLALIPVFILWFGLGISSKVAVTTMVVFFLIFFGTVSGVRSVDKELTDVLRVIGASRARVHTKVTLPSALAWILSALHVTVPYAFVATVLAEMLAGGGGLGYLMIRGSNLFRSDQVFATVVVLVALAVCLNGAVTWIEKYFMRWQRSSVTSAP